MAVINHNLDHVILPDLIMGYKKLVRACPSPRAKPVQDAIDTIADALSQRNYILCDCESGNQRVASVDDHQHFIFWACDSCGHSKWQQWHERK